MKDGQKTGIHFFVSLQETIARPTLNLALGAGNVNSRMIRTTNDAANIKPQLNTTSTQSGSTASSICCDQSPLITFQARSNAARQQLTKALRCVKADTKRCKHRDVPPRAPGFSPVRHVCVLSLVLESVGMRSRQTILWWGGTTFHMPRSNAA